MEEEEKTYTIDTDEGFFAFQGPISADKSSIMSAGKELYESGAPIVVASGHIGEDGLHVVAHLRAELAGV